MASVLAGAVVEKVCELALQQARNEVSIVYHFTEDLESLKNRFMEINSVLNEAEEESSQKEFVKSWLHRVRDIAWEAEDILQEFAVDSLYSPSPNTRLASFIPTQFIRRHKFGRRIRKVKDRLNSVVSDGNQLNIVRAQSRTLQSHRREEAAESSTSHEHEFRRPWVLPSDSKAVGIESKIENIASLLENPQNSMFAVVGMGGVGKTYLLQHVFNRIKDRYDKSAWLSVSRFYSVSKLQRDLALQLDKELSKEIMESGVSEVIAEGLINGFMLDKRCVIVLDDVWRTSREGNLVTRLGIPVGGNSQCKIMVSTRSREVCENLNAEIYEMECLTDEESWRLFCAHAFPKSQENRAPEKLEVVAREIEKKCGKLPLAIKVIAASVERTVELSEWVSMLDKLKKVGTGTGTGTSKDYEHVMDILKLSYTSLPAHLKACFAYFSFFPEDEEMECEYLMYLWMAEWFILAGQNPWDCVRHLANLCLVEVWEDEHKFDNPWGLKKCCRIHGLLLDLAIVVSRENKCAFGVQEAFCRLQDVNSTGGGVR